MKSNTSSTVTPLYAATETRTDAPRPGTGTAALPDWYALDAKITLLAQAVESLAVRLESSSSTGELAALTAQVADLTSTPAPGQQAVSVEQAARLLGCGRSTVFVHLRRGKLRRAKRIGRRVMVTVESINALLSPRPAPPRPPTPTQRDDIAARIRAIRV